MNSCLLISAVVGKHVAKVVKTFGKPPKTESLDDFRYNLSISVNNRLQHRPSKQHFYRE